jgi:nitrate/TMAO reductase-like tetraheme cytochrome c subunit
MRAPGIFWLILAVVAAIGIVGGAAAWGALTYTASPAFCASCHVMETRYVSWRRSGHADRASCIECHSEPGPWGELKAHLNGTRYLYVMLTGEKSGAILRAEVAAATCERCHSPAGLPERTPHLVVRHGLHRGRGVECTACHAGLVHGALNARDVRPASDVCAACHAGRGVLHPAGVAGSPVGVLPRARAEPSD